MVKVQHPFRIKKSLALQKRCCSQALCSFGPGSAAGLLGYKPFLLQQCVRAESFVFTRALTSAVSEFSCGRAPAFLKRYVAGGVSIALEKTKTSVRPLA